MKEAASSGCSLREVAREQGVEASVLDEALDYRAMAKPRRVVRYISSHIEANVDSLYRGIYARPRPGHAVEGVTFVIDNGEMRD